MVDMVTRSVRDGRASRAFVSSRPVPVLRGVQRTRLQVILDLTRPGSRECPFSAPCLTIPRPASGASLQVRGGFPSPRGQRVTRVGLRAPHTYRCRGSRNPVAMNGQNRSDTVIWWFLKAGSRPSCSGVPGLQCFSHSWTLTAGGAFFSTVYIPRGRCPWRHPGLYLYS
jgi:hypothetical protein